MPSTRLTSVRQLRTIHHHYHLNEGLPLLPLEVSTLSLRNGSQISPSRWMLPWSLLVWGLHAHHGWFLWPPELIPSWWVLLVLVLLAHGSQTWRCMWITCQFFKNAASVSVKSGMRLRWYFSNKPTGTPLLRAQEAHWEQWGSGKWCILAWFSPMPHVKYCSCHISG